MSINEKALDVLMEAELEELYAAIGHYESVDRFGATPPDKAKLIEIGKNWIESNSEKFRAKICPSDVAQEILSSSETTAQDIKNLIPVVADLIISLSGGVPATYVATLLLRIGLRKWCEQNE